VHLKRIVDGVLKVQGAVRVVDTLLVQQRAVQISRFIELTRVVIFRTLCCLRFKGRRRAQEVSEGRIFILSRLLSRRKKHGR